MYLNTIFRFRVSTFLKTIFHETAFRETLLQTFRDLVHQPFGFSPAQAWVGDGLSIAAIADLLAAGFYVAPVSYTHLAGLSGGAALQKSWLLSGKIREICLLQPVWLQRVTGIWAGGGGV